LRARTASLVMIRLACSTLVRAGRRLSHDDGERLRPVLVHSTLSLLWDLCSGNLLHIASFPGSQPRILKASPDEVVALRTCRVLRENRAPASLIVLELNRSAAIGLLSTSWHRFCPPIGQENVAMIEFALDAFIGAGSTWYWGDRIRHSRIAT
jgi:hypothetical protein